MELSELTGVSKRVEVFDPEPSLPRPLDLVGIEVEIERVPPEDLRYWNCVRDGSLRDGREFVLREPLYGTGILTALQELQNFFDDVSPQVSERCSVHIHLNVSDMEVQEFQKLLVMYVIFERVLFQYHQGRADNVFCIPWYKANTPIESILELQDVDDVYRWAMMNTEKYTSLNVLPITQFGSIEFRHMAGTKNTSEILEWLKIVMRLREFCSGDLNLKDLPGYLSGTGGKRFLREVFKEQAEVLMYPDLDADILKGIRTAQRAIYVSRDRNQGLVSTDTLPSGSLFNNTSIRDRVQRARMSTDWSQQIDTAQLQEIVDSMNPPILEPTDTSTASPSTAWTNFISPNTRRRS